MTTLVTGAAGFAGSTLVETLATEGVAPVATSRRGERGALPAAVDVEVRACDLDRPDEIRSLIADLRPAVVYHLAARTFVPDSEKDAAGFLRTNLMGTVRLLEALEAEAPGCRVLAVSSAGVYGASGGAGRPLPEDAPLAPLNPYAASKAAMELWVAQAQARSRLHLVRVRPFGHTGPRQTPRFAAADFASQIGRIRAGEQEPVLEVGNLEAVREFSDVRDMVAGYRAAAEHGKAGAVYNLCSGRGTSIRELLALMLRRSGVAAEIRTRSERLRPADVPALVGSPTRALEELGWRTRVPLEDTVDRLLERWGALDDTRTRTD